MSGAKPAQPQDKRITILGATGSVGQATLDLVEDARARSGPDAFPVEALASGRNVKALAQACRRVRPRFAAIADEAAYGALKAALADMDVEVGAGPHAVLEAAQRPADWVMAAIVGAAGLAPTLAAARRGAEVALANKEALVCAGPLFTRAAAEGGATLLPVDSEHNAIFQVLDPAHRDHVERLVLTASGGPFRSWSMEAMASVTPAQAVAHPNWSMGAKISVDSATMMNKGLELIEASYLFGVESARIDILVHPQSVIHSLVAYGDGSVLAQLGEPDMRVPIASALAWPQRMATAAPRLDLAAIARLDFEAPDVARFPCLSLARAALEAGGIAPAALNAANEMAVASFLDDRIGFLDIYRVVERCVNQLLINSTASSWDGALDDVLEADRAARKQAGEAMHALGASA